MKRVELLAPAKDLAIGIAAINHGADAVYIGAPAFGARKAAAHLRHDLHQGGYDALPHAHSLPQLSLLDHTDLCLCHHCGYLYVLQAAENQHGRGAEIG